MDGPAFFGSPEQRAVLRRGRAMADLLANDPRFTYYGRTVGLATPEDGDLGQLAALVRAQGNSNYAHVEDGEVPALVRALEEDRLAPLVYAKWEGDGAPFKAAQALLDHYGLPDDLSLRWLDASTPFATLESLADTALACGVLPAARSTLTGSSGRSACVVAEDATGRVVSVAAASAYAHPEHRLSGQAWWGMLATHPERRGERLALILGAHVILRMEKEFGFTDFMTGVEIGNAPSEAVCTRMGLAPRGFSLLGCADPEALSGGRMTK